MISMSGELMTFFMHDEQKHLSGITLFVSAKWPLFAGPWSIRNQHLLHRLQWWSDISWLAVAILRKWTGDRTYSNALLTILVNRNDHDWCYNHDNPAALLLLCYVTSDEIQIGRIYYCNLLNRRYLFHSPGFYIHQIWSNKLQYLYMSACFVSILYSHVNFFDEDKIFKAIEY